MDQRQAGRGIGSFLLKDALKRCVLAADAIGGRAIIVRAIDSSAAAYWQSNGFVPAKDDPATLFRSVENIAHWLAEAER